MSEDSKGTNPLHLLVISVVGLLLSFGLCGAGSTYDKFGFLFPAGVLVLAISITLFLVGIIGLFSRR